MTALVLVMVESMKESAVSMAMKMAEEMEAMEYPVLEKVLKEKERVGLVDGGLVNTSVIWAMTTVLTVASLANGLLKVISVPEADATPALQAVDTNDVKLMLTLHWLETDAVLTVIDGGMLMVK